MGFVRRHLTSVNEANADQHQGCQHQQRAEQAQKRAAIVFGYLHRIVVGHAASRARAVPRTAPGSERPEIAKEPSQPSLFGARANAPRRRRLPRLACDHRPQRSTGARVASVSAQRSYLSTMLRTSWLPVLCTLACTSPRALTASRPKASPRQPLPPAASASKGPVTAAASEADAASRGQKEQALARAACAQRQQVEPACHAVEWLSGGTDSAGQELVVVKLALFEQPGVGDDFARRAAGECDHYEYWLVPVVEGRIGEPRLLLGVCNDGYGASGVGEDSVEVSANTFEHSQYGGSAWRWSEKISVSLSPLRPRSLETHSYWTLGAQFVSTRFDWDAFRGREAWYTPYCKADGSVDPDVPDSDDLSVGGDLEVPPDYAYASELVPGVTLDPKFVESPASVELGACALTLDAGKTTGFVLEGTPGEPGDASLSVVANADGTRLFLELRDDVTTLRPRRLFDRLELWSSEAEGARTGTHCVEPPKARLSAFDIDRAGRVERKRGQGQAPKVSVASPTSGVQRFVLEWPQPLARFTLVYADSDDGTTLERRVATSLLRPDNADSLGYLRRIPAGDATCQVQSGRLEPVVTLSYVPKLP